MNQHLRKAAKQLRYRPLPDLIGKQVVLKSTVSAPDAIHKVIADSLEVPVQFRKPERWRIACELAKYQILDLEFSVNGLRWRDDDLGGTTVLRNLGFVKH